MKRMWVGVCACFLVSISLWGSDFTEAKKQLSDKESTWDARRKAALDLADCGEQGLKQLIRYLMSTNKNISLGARVGLLKVGEHAFEPLLDKIKNGSKYEKSQAAAALGDFGKDAESLAPQLAGLLTSYDENLKNSAQAALLSIGRELDVPQDSITLKSGRVLRGMVRKTSKEQITFDSLQKSRSGSSVIQTLIATKEIKSYTICPKDKRPLLKAKVEAIKARKQELSTRGQDLNVIQKKIEGVLVNTYETPEFLVFSTAPNDFIRETAHRVIAMIRAYEDHMNTRVAPGGQLKVYIAGSEKEYQAMQEELMGKAMKNPAFYIPDANMIWGYSDIGGYRTAVRDAKEHHDKIREENAELQKSLKEAERKLKVDIEEVRQDINRQISEIERKLDGLGLSRTQRARAKGELMREVEKVKKEIARDIKEIKNNIRKYKSALKTNNRILREADEKNLQLLKNVTSEMFEMMGHEAFHAFFNNRIRKPDQPKDNARWLNEGLAMYFQSAVFDGVELMGGEPQKDWISFLKKKQKENKLQTVEQLLKGNQDDFLVHSVDHAENASIFYLQSWYLVRLLSEMGLLSDPEKISGFIGDLAKEPEGYEKAFKNMTGMDLKTAQGYMDGYIQSDDYGTYRLLQFRTGTGPLGMDSAVGRIIMKSTEELQIKLRSGQTFVVKTGDVLNPGF